MGKINFPSHLTIKKTIRTLCTVKVSHNAEELAKYINESKSIVCFTGAGVSAESGLPVFSGKPATFRSFNLKELVSAETFNQNPGLVWEYYHYMREIVFKAIPNKAHLALATLERKCSASQKNFTLITRNIDGLHTRAGSENVIELNGNILQVQCTKCKNICENKEHPICTALQGKGDPNLGIDDLEIIEAENLPRCKKCRGLLRPYVVWFGEDMHPGISEKSIAVVKECDVLLIVGSSNIYYPGALFGPMVYDRNGVIAEFNINKAHQTYHYQFYFQGPCTATLPHVVDRLDAVTS